VAAAAGGAPAASSNGRVALVQGSSRGLGLEFVRQLLQRPDTSVVATCRTPPAAAQLLELQQQHGGRLAVLQLDSTDEASISRAAEEVRWLLAHCAAVRIHAHVLECRAASHSLDV
jgi:NAD(P)-dependent dehydrogenase (short-subunit alcohol dehydrogenase family)